MDRWMDRVDLIICKAILAVHKSRPPLVCDDSRVILIASHNRLRSTLLLEGILKVFEAILKAGSQGPAARGRPQWEGTFGESTYGRRWASPKLCLSQCFRDLQSLRSTAPSEPEAQWPDLQWACGPKPATEPAVLCASVPQRSQRILWEVISNSVFDRVVGRAQASKRTLERLENELPGV